MMRKRSLVLTFAVVFVLLNAGELFAQQGGQYRLGISYGSSIFSNKERFEFMIGGGRKIALTKDSPTAYFPATFSPGQAYSITQVSRPRTCSFFGQERGTFSSQDILITASCGNPPFSLFKLRVTRSIAAAEIVGGRDGGPVGGAPIGFLLQSALTMTGVVGTTPSASASRHCRGPPVCLML